MVGMRPPRVSNGCVSCTWYDVVGEKVVLMTWFWFFLWLHFTNNETLQSVSLASVWLGRPLGHLTFLSVASQAGPMEHQGKENPYYKVQCMRPLIKERIILGFIDLKHRIVKCKDPVIRRWLRTLALGNYCSFPTTQQKTQNQTQQRFPSRVDLQEQELATYGRIHLLLRTAWIIFLFC
jgi:hypothetical protein